MKCLLPIDSNKKSRLASAFLNYATKAENIIAGWILEKSKNGIIYEYETSISTRSMLSTNKAAPSKNSWCSSWHNYGLAVKFIVRLKMPSGDYSLVEYSKDLYEDVSSYIYDNHRTDIKGMPGSTSELIWGGMFNVNNSIWYFEWHPGYEVNDIQRYRTEYLNKIFPAMQNYNPANIIDNIGHRQKQQHTNGEELSGAYDQENLTLSEFYSIYSIRRDINGVRSVDIKDLDEYVKSNIYSTYYEYIMSYIKGESDKCMILKRYLQINGAYETIKDENLKIPEIDSKSSLLASSSAEDGDMGFIPEGLRELSQDSAQQMSIEASIRPRLDGDKLVTIDDDGFPVYYQGLTDMSVDSCEEDSNTCIGDFGPSGRLSIIEYTKKQNDEYVNRTDRISRYFISNRNTDGTVDADLDPIMPPANSEIIGGIPIVRTGEEEMITPPGAPNIFVKRGNVEVHIPTLLKKSRENDSILYK